jgi:short-subunit dehydrogenase
VPMTRQKILITGASSGLGAGMARAFAAKGRDLALCARRTDRLDELKAELLERHPGITVAVAALDVNDHEQVPKVFAELSDELGRIDRIIVNAGIGKGAPLGSGKLWANKGVPGVRAAYAASKAGVSSLGESLRAEYAKGPIKVTVIEPGYIESEMTAKAETTQLMVDNETGTKAMADAIEREPGRAAVPTWPWAPLVQLLRVLPPALAAKFA